MNEPIVSIFDIETDDIDAKIIRCLSFYDVNTKTSATITDYDVMRKYFQRKDVYFCGHHIIGFDIPVVERLLGIKVTNPIIDTLALSWTLSSNRNSHGLQSYGDEYGIEKPKIDDYAKQDIEEIKRRCSQDVLINLKVWENQKWYLNELYDGNWEQILKYIEYLTFKLQCVAKQQELGVKLDIPLVKETLMNLEDLKIQKTEALTAAMPKQPIKTIKKYPKVFRKANGELSTNGQKWIELIKEKGFPEDYINDIEVITGYNNGNPNSHAQIKNWLFDLGWEPGWYKYVKEEGKSEMRKIPQVASKDEPGEVCESIKKLIEKEPALEELSSLGIISHRISIFKGFLRDQKDGKIYQGTSGLTNTLRLQHTGIVNLPSSDKPFSENVRASLIPDDGMIMCGTDLQGIEDNTKRHYIFPFDPEYVKSQMTEGFDAHLDIAQISGLLTPEQVEEHKLYEATKDKEIKLGKSYKLIRAKAKQVNFSAIYGVGAPTLSRNMGITKKEAQTFIDAYWKRNWAVKEVAESLQIKHIGAQMWLFNPVSKFWYSLRAEKDKFSTLNQGTAVYVFDKYVENAIKLGIIPIKQIHDEFSTNIFPENKEKTTQLLKLAIQKVNEELKLNVTISASIDYGNNYANCH
jgi:hypothetical protein